MSHILRIGERTVIVDECRSCDGSGRDSTEGDGRCLHCHGSGETESTACEECGGTCCQCDDEPECDDPFTGTP